MKFRALLAHKKSFALALTVFEITKSCPKKEAYWLTDQIRRYSKSRTGAIAEVYRKKIYPQHFYNKLTDPDGENSETQVLLNFVLACKYSIVEIYNDCISESFEIGKWVNYMLLNPENFGVKKEYKISNRFNWMLKS